jgi:hypothetical protein
MRILRPALVFALLILPSCASSRLEGCLPLADLAGRAQRVANLDWKHFTPDRAEDILPPEQTALSTSDEFAHPPCDGLLHRTEQSRIIRGHCDCCVILVFAAELQQATCTPFLDAFIVRDTTRTLAEAQDVIDAIAQVFGGKAFTGFNRAAPLPSSGDQVWRNVPAQGIDTMLEVGIDRTQFGYHVYIYVGRTYPGAG